MRFKEMNERKFIYDGITMSGIIALGQYFSTSYSWIKPIMSNWQATALIGISIVTGIGLDMLFGENKYDKLFRNCGIINKDGKLPIVIKKQDNNLIINMPEGISQKHFEEKQQEIEQALNAKIEFGYNKNLIIKCTPIELKTHYDYNYVPCKSRTAINIGCTNDGLFELDISKDQHIIFAGETDSGKSSALDILILGILLGNSPIDIHLIDFQDVTLGKYEDCKKVKSYGSTAEQFSNLLDEMEQLCKERLKLFRTVKNKIYIEKLETWNKEFPKKALPFKLIIIDEFATISKNEELLEKFNQRVAKDRKAGIHYCIALQRPDAKIIDGSIKANMSTRLAFKVVSPVDSEVILGGLRGAEKIKHQGRFLARQRGKLQEVQAFYIEPKNIRKLLVDNNCYKTKDDIQAERKKIIADYHKKCINPYIKGVHR